MKEETESHAHSDLQLAAKRILVVDDDPLILKALEKTLESEGYQILKAQNGKQAVDILQRVPLATIVCDHHMPEMNGLEVLRLAVQLQPEAVRIVLTGISDLKIVEQLINVGQISQFIVKPWDHASLVQTIHSSVEKYRLVIENQRLEKLTLHQHQELEENHQKLQNELHLGGQVQSTLLVGKTPRHIPGISIEALSLASQEIDGDFYDFFHPAPEFLDLIVGDVMGKGLPAALVGTAVKTQISRFAIPLSQTQVYDHMEGWRYDILSPEGIMQRVRREIAKPLIELEYFVTLIYGRFDWRRRVFSYVDCGATQPLHYQKKTGKAALLQGGNLPLGISEDESYQTFEVSFTDKDIFIFYSDGVTESRSPAGELYGITRLAALIEKHADQRPAKLQQIIKENIAAFSHKATLEDDLTLIIIAIDDLTQLNFKEISISRTFPGNLEQLAVLRECVAQLCSRAQGNAQRLSSLLQLAINEAFCNIVEHGYKDTSQGEIVLKGELVKDGIVFEISDYGRPFDPSLLQDPSLAGDQDRGLGFYMIKQVSDHISYTPKQTEDGMNHLCLFKKYLFHEENMEITHQVQDQTLILCLEGKNLDAKEAAEFKKKATELLHNVQVPHVILDLQHLNFIDSSGLGSFLSLLRLVNGRGGDIKIACMTKPIRTIFELVCMHKIFEIYNTKEEALRSFRAHR